MSESRIYMDYNATTPLHPRVKQVMIEAMDLYGNASSMHEYGRDAHNEIERARASIAQLIGAEPEEIFFTSGGTESNNTVLQTFSCSGSNCSQFSVRGCSDFGHGIITSKIEHPSVLSVADHLEHKGTRIAFLPVDATGRVEEAPYRKLLTEKYGLVSIMMANNEIGTIQDVKHLATLAKEHGLAFHTDAVQAVGKIPVNVKDLGVDYLSASGHKIHGPKGVGFLYARRGSPLCAYLMGGHQENGFRAGTYNTLGIIGLGEAARLAREYMDSEAVRLAALRDAMADKITAAIPDIHINGNREHSLPGTLNVSFQGAEGEALLLYLDMAGIAVSTGSACASGSLDPSHVLLATGIDDELAHGSIRFSLGMDTTEAEVDRVVEEMTTIAAKVRRMSTAYKPQGDRT